MGIGAATGNAGVGTVAEVTVGTLACLPAVMVVAGVAAALFGLRPSMPALAWIVVAYAVIFGMFGALLNLPGVIADLSPFAHTTAMPLADLPLTPLALLTGLAIVLAIAGATSFRRRDLEST